MSDLTTIEKIFFKDDRNRDIVIEKSIKKCQVIPLLNYFNYIVHNSPLSESKIEQYFEIYLSFIEQKFDNFSANRKAIRSMIEIIVKD